MQQHLRRLLNFNSSYLHLLLYIYELTHFILVPILHMRRYINDLGGEEKAEGPWKEQKGSHLFQASARAACQTYPTVSSICAMPSKHNFWLGRQRRKVMLSCHARSNVILLNFELLNHGLMVDWESGDSESSRQRQTASIYKYQLPSSRVIKYDASHNHHWVQWEELFRIGKTHHICLLSREKKHSTLLKNLQKLWYFLASYFDQWHLHDIMLFFMYCLLTQAITEPKHDPAHLIRALFDRVFYYSPSFQKEILQ